MEQLTQLKKDMQEALEAHKERIELLQTSAITKEGLSKLVNRWHLAWELHETYKIGAFNEDTKQVNIDKVTGRELKSAMIQALKAHCQTCKDTIARLEEMGA